MWEVPLCCPSPWSYCESANPSALANVSYQHKGTQVLISHTNDHSMNIKADSWQEPWLCSPKAADVFNVYALIHMQFTCEAVDPFPTGNTEEA